MADEEAPDARSTLEALASKNQVKVQPCVHARVFFNLFACGFIPLSRDQCNVPGNCGTDP